MPLDFIYAHKPLRNQDFIEFLNIPLKGVSKITGFLRAPTAKGCCPNYTCKLLQSMLAVCFRNLTPAWQTCCRINTLSLHFSLQSLDTFTDYTIEKEVVFFFSFFFFYLISICGETGEI